MLRIISLIFFLIIGSFTNFVEAAEKTKVAVMDLGEFSGAFTNELSTDNVGAMVSTHIANNLANNKRFIVISRRYFKDQLDAKNLQISGLISSNKAGEIAKILGIDYLIYGNVDNVDGIEKVFDVKLNGGKFHELKVCLIVRMMDVKTGRIIAAAKGEGISKSTEFKGGKGGITLKIGTTEIPQICVHNAMEKAARNVVEKLIQKFPES